MNKPKICTSKSGGIRCERRRHKDGRHQAGDAKRGIFEWGDLPPIPTPIPARRFTVRDGERAVVVVLRSEYTVDGGAVLEDDVGRIDLDGKKRGGVREAVSLFVSRDALGLYPIGAKVRVTVERLT
jgi:hypothetical protein